MKHKSHDAHLDSVAIQYWAGVTDAEHDNWQTDEIDTVYKWVRDNMAQAATHALTEIDVHDDVSIITVLSKDCPFIIDSLTALVQRRGYSIAGLIHPVLQAEEMSVSVSVVSMRLRESLTDQEAAMLGADVDQVMEDVMLATQDWRDMRDKMRALVDVRQNDTSADEEETAFLSYLCDNNFTYLGYMTTIARTLAPKDGLGVLSADRKTSLFRDFNVPLPTALHDKEKNGLVIFKLPITSNVHRPVRYDAVVVKEKDKKGVVVLEHVFIGLFTSVTYSRSIKDVPLLRHKVREVIDNSKFAIEHHDYKALTHILEKYPRDELFRIDIDTLTAFTHGIMRLQERQRIALFARTDTLTHNISALVYIPRERFETRLRLQIQSILEREYKAVSEGFTISLDDSPLVRVLFSLRAFEDNGFSINASDIESKVIEETRSWNDKMRGILPRDLAVKYADVFPFDYQRRYDTQALTYDVANIEKLLTSQELQMELYRPSGMRASRMRFKIYAMNDAVPLSDVLPILENFGFHVLSEQPFELNFVNPACTVWLHDFYVCAKDPGTEYEIERLRPVFEETFLAIWQKKAASDILNRLTTRAEMPVRDVMILRSYTRYLHQIRIGYSPSYVLATLGDYPVIAALIISLFDARFNPAINESERTEKENKIRADIEAQLALVTSLDQDTIFRRLHNLVESTIRTNAYQTDVLGKFKDYISFKIDCAQVTKMPDPRPMYEIFVFSARMEGLHLRAGKVARGGIRWSDRADDYRTEILGLVKAQVVKNSVIVPTGAKGGFIVKNPPKTSDRKAIQDEGIECYKILMRGLLDITDNLISGNVIPPKNVVRYDGDDVYLVVAADKGTASFSDIANSLSEEYEFWIGDAFASGGSVGYDHKEMGITAKGAWECIERHFRELGKNIQAEEFSVIGVGDMSGDVFGNGMLLSPHIKLIGAFNHRHIFCDPAPNAAKSFAERERLFREVSGWENYKTSLLSKGGKIFERSEKSLSLTKEIKESFGLNVDEITPDDLIQAMLKTPVELLYFGGIGTYIKDESESHLDVSDRANDRLRINASEVRASVIGEGANLGITQNARVALDKQGARLNTDFIDNSAGVDCSDHEVNIKLLFNHMMQNDASLTISQRNIMLEEMTKSVGELVLRDNYQQGQAITLIKMQGAVLLPQHAMTIDRLEAGYDLKRKVEFLPSYKDMMERQNIGQGLSRPEIAVLISYAKMALKRDLISSDIPDRHDVSIWLESYFPEMLRIKYKDKLAQHPLRREIIATQIANSIVNRMGPHFIFEKQEETGLSVASIVDAYLLGREALNMNPLWHAIESLDNQIDNIVQMRLMEKTTRILERLVRRFLSIYGERLRASISAKTLRDQLTDVMPDLLDLLSDELREHYHQRMSQLKEQKVSKSIAEAVTLLPYAVMAVEALQLSGNGNKNEVAIKTYFATGARFQIETIRQQARFLASEHPENASALSSLMDSLVTAQGGLTMQILQVQGDDEKLRLETWISEHQESVNVIDRLLDGLQDGLALNLGRLVLLEQKIRQLAQRG